MYLDIVLFVLAFTLYVYHLWNETYSYWKRRGVVGPTPWPIIGNYGSVILRKNSESQMIQQLYDEYPQEKCVGLFFGTYPVLLLRDPKMIRQVLSTAFDKFPNRIISSTITDFKKSIFTMDGDGNFKPTKKMVMSLFQKNNLARIMPVLNVATKNYVDYLDKIVETKTDLEMYDSVAKYGQEIVSKALLGVNLGKIEEKSTFQSNTHRITRLESAEILRTVDLILPNVMRFVQLLTKSIAKNMFQFYSNIVNIAINRPKKENDSETMVDLFVELAKKTKENNSNRNIDDELLNENMVTFTVTLLETVGNVIALLFNKLAQNQKVQEKCYEEIRRVLDKYNGELTYESLSEIEYLDMVLKEVLRQQVLSPTIDRICAGKYRFAHTDLNINKGVLVCIPLEALQTDDKYFPDPKAFIPERFSPENKMKITPYTYFLFGEGCRYCMGKKLATMVIKTNLVMFLQKFSVAPAINTPKDEFDPRYRSRRIRGGLPLKIQRRVTSL